MTQVYQKAESCKDFPMVHCGTAAPATPLLLFNLLRQRINSPHARPRLSSTCGRLAVDDAPSTTRRGRYLPDHNFDIANTSLDFGSTFPAVFDAGELPRATCGMTVSPDRRAGANHRGPLRQSCLTM
jgi:hypothetical protein